MEIEPWRWKDIFEIPFLILAVLGFVCYACIYVSFFLIIYPFFYLFQQQSLFHRFAISAAHIGWWPLVLTVEKWGRWEFVISGDLIPDRETAIVITNHRWIIDWLMIFSFACRKGRLGCCRFFAKNSIKYIPGFGWALYILDCVFLKRNWTNDSKSIQKVFKNLKGRKLPFWLISHVEGTRFTKEKIKKSQDFAKKKDLPIFNYVLSPRTKGFTATVMELAEAVDAVYDVTITYLDGKKCPTMTSIIFRRGGRVNLHIRRYPIQEIPQNEKELSQWLLDRWEEKEKLIQEMVQQGHFPKVRNEPLRHIPW